MVIFLPLMVSSVHETFREIHAVRGRPESPVCFPCRCDMHVSRQLRDAGQQSTHKHVPAVTGNYFNLKMIGFGESTSARLLKA
jgi:hypothetical protein